MLADCLGAFIPEDVEVTLDWSLDPEVRGKAGGKFKVNAGGVEPGAQPATAYSKIAISDSRPLTVFERLLTAWMSWALASVALELGGGCEDCADVISFLAGRGKEDWADHFLPVYLDFPGIAEVDWAVSAGESGAEMVAILSSNRRW